MLDGLVRLAAHVCDAPMAMLTLLEDARQVFLVQEGFKGAADAPARFGLCPVVAEQGVPLVIRDALTEPPQPGGRTHLVEGVRFYAGVPLFATGQHEAGQQEAEQHGAEQHGAERRAFGVLCVFDAAPRPDGLSAVQMKLLQTLAAQVASQFDLRRALAEQAAAVRERTLLARVQAAIATADGHLPTVLPVLVESALQAMPSAEGGVLELIDGAELVYHAVCGTLRPAEGMRIPLHGSLAGRCATENTPMLVDDAPKDGRVAPELAARLSFRSAVLAPVAQGGQVTGVLKLVSRKAGAFGPQALQVVRLFAGAATAGLAEAQAAEVRRAAAVAAQRQRAIFDSTTEFAIIVTDRDGRVTDWNTGAERILGWTAAEMRGELVSRAFVPEEVAAGVPEAEMRQALEHGRAGEERWHVRRDGSRFWASGEMMPLQGDDGARPGAEVLGFVRILRDRTAEHRTGEALRDAEARFRAFAQTVPNHIWSATPNGQLDWANERAHGYLGVEPGSVLGSEWASAVHPDDRAEAGRRWAGAVAAGQPYETEFRLRRADSVFRWFIGRALPIHGRDGQVVRWVGTNTDIEDQKQASAALARVNGVLAQRVEERTRERDRVWDISTDLLVVMGPDGHYRNVNPAWTRALGWTRGELIGAEYRQFAHPEDYTLLEAAFTRLRDGQPIRDVDVRLRQRNGAWRTYSWTGVLEGTEVYGTGRDVTDSRMMEEQLRQSQKMEAVGQLTGGLAHDFNNLLTGIMGSLDLLGRRVEQGRVAELGRYIGVAQDAARRAATLTHRLLAFSRQQTLDPKPTDVNGLVAGMEELVQRTVGPAIIVEVAPAPDLWPTLVDPNQLENALLNLCINARDAMPGGGRLAVATANRVLDGAEALELELDAGEYVSMCVADTGTGMGPEVVAKAFDPFFTTKPPGQGTGLGLSMIYGFVRQSGGQARISSAPGAGTTVCLFLPRYRGSADMAEASLPEVATGLRMDGTGRTVLVVDDEPTVRLLAREVLEAMGWAALDAEDAARGLQVLRTAAPIDLLVTDVGLPGGMDGCELAEAARVVRPGLPVLFITGYAEAALNSVLPGPGTQVMTKPFALEALARRIRELVGREELR